MSIAVQDHVYRCPQDLTQTPTNLRRIIIIGSCLMAGWPGLVESETPGCAADFLLLNNVGQLAHTPPRPIAEYDFQLVQVPLRTIIPDGSYFRLAYCDYEDYERLFDESIERMRQFVYHALVWNREHSLLTFVSNFLTPQQNSLGRLMPRYDLRNLVYFVERLNQELAQLLSSYQNVFLFDFDQIVGTFGRRYFQDDVILHTGHGSALTDGDYQLDQDRLESTDSPRSFYPTRIYEHMQCAWAELIAMYRTVRRTDEVKLVIVDIDDTLWRGVAAERSVADPVNSMEGWPLGVIEALGCLKRRGILLAIVSKNDEDRIASVWPSLIGNRLSLNDFAVRKINWRPKVENVDELLQEVGILPKSVLFIDDNPVERASVEAAFPNIRTLGPTPYVWRRILLWSAETQVAQMTAESVMRTNMVRAQIVRERQRTQLTRQEFLDSLRLSVALYRLNSQTQPRFPRSLELINKTNQFNTTGQRWTLQESVELFASGGCFYTFEAEDRFTNYGLIGVAIMLKSELSQFVMSCRVLGMDVEIAAIAGILKAELEVSASAIEARLKHTETNLACRDLYERCAFIPTDTENWRFPRDKFLDVPAHINLTNNASARPQSTV